MSIRNLMPGASGAALAFMLSACGGGGGASSMPTPPPTPTPSPAPDSAADPLSAAPLGVTASTSLASIGDLHDVRWNADLKAYEVTVDGTSARVNGAGGGPYAEAAELIAANGDKLPYSLQAFTGYAYTRYGYVQRTGTSRLDPFVFGAATPAGAVPTTGSATYDAEITGHAGSWGLYGTAEFAFDFAAGTLSGHMDPHTNGPMESPPLPQYTFTQTVFAPGSGTFSGSFDIAGPTPSSFQGQFTGPHAEELMAGFTAPFRDWDQNENPTLWGIMEGVMAGRKH